MSAFAPPLQNDDLVYQDGLYIDVGKANRHKRATTAELTALLRPPINSLVPKDEPGHYYEAQLVHYGLQKSKVKATAKIRLLDALNRGALEVPSSILEKEKEMKKEWDAANRKAKKAFNNTKDKCSILTAATVDYKPQMRPLTAEPTAASKKRKVEASTTKQKATKLAKVESGTPKKSATLTNVSVSIPAQSAATKPRENPNAKRGGASAGVRGRGRGAKQVSNSTRTSGDVPPILVNDRPPFRTKQTARRGAYHGTSSQFHPAIYTVSPNENDERESFTSESRISDEDQTFTSDSRISDEDHGEQAHENSPEDEEEEDPFDRQSGIYKINCETISEEWPSIVPANGLRLKLLYCPSSHSFWGHFNLGMFIGTFRTSTPELRDNGTGVYMRFTWRARDSGGENVIMGLGPGHTGFLKISKPSGLGSIVGSFSRMYGEKCDFAGKELLAPRGAIGTEYDFRRQFESLSEAQYEEERVNRWK